MRILLGFLLLLATVAQAVVVATPSLPQFPTLGKAQVLNATGTITIASNGASVSNSITAYTCETTNGAASKIMGMFAGSTDTAAMTLQVLIVNTSKIYVLTTVTIPIGAGTVAGTSVVDMLSAVNTPGLPHDSDNNPYFTCVTGDTIVVGVTGTVTANKVVTVLTVGADF